MDINSKRKRLIIHDLGACANMPALRDGDQLLDAAQITRPCIGCFGCWTKTPTRCVIRDGFENIGVRFAACDELVVISRCVYGGFSPDVKNVLDRCIGYLTPFFTLRSDKQMHHRARYSKQLTLTACFYGGDMTGQERATAERLIARNALNLNAAEHSVTFYQSAAEIGRKPA